MATPITPREQDFPRWYQDLINKAELADNGPVRGTMVIRPWGYAIWGRMRGRAGRSHQRCRGGERPYFPLFIPEELPASRSRACRGVRPGTRPWSPTEVSKQLEEPVVVRPTSETVISNFFAKWIQSYRDLPLLINQWANVVRWELRPRLFLRTSEFLWQEGHTAHATASEAPVPMLCGSSTTSIEPPWSTCSPSRF